MRDVTAESEVHNVAEALEPSTRIVLLGSDWNEKAKMVTLNVPVAGILFGPVCCTCGKLMLICIWLV